MDYFFTLIKDNKEAVTFIITVSGSIGFILNYLLARKKIKNDKKALRQQMITNNIAPMRQAWINDVRKSAADFFSDINIIITYLYTDNKGLKKILKEDYVKKSLTISAKYSYLDLLLPFKQDENQEEEAEDVRILLEKIKNNISISKKDDNKSLKEMKKDISDCREKLKLLLKKEWGVTKSLKEIE